MPVGTACFSHHHHLHGWAYWVFRGKVGTHGTIEATPSPAHPTPPLWKRLAWLVVIWAASVTTMFTLSGLLRLWLKR